MVIFLRLKSMQELLTVDSNMVEVQIFATQTTTMSKQFFSPVANQR